MWSVIVVGYRTAGLLRDLARSVDAAFRGAEHEIVYVDNSGEHVEDVPPNVRYLQPGGNLGFAGGCNYGVAQARGDVFFFLNPDCVVDAIGDLRSVSLDSSAVWLPFVRESQCGDAYGAHRNRFPLLSELWPRARSNGEAGWFRGSALIVHRTTFERLGGWDERYFMYAEDMDLFWTAQMRGIPTVHLPVFVTHAGAGATSGVWSAFRRERMVQRATALFFKKFRAPWSAVFWYPLLLIRAAIIAPARNWSKLPAYCIEGARALAGRSGNR